MYYQLHHEGRNLGSFSLEELQRRRAADELTGRELVWAVGMEQWQSLDSILQGGFSDVVRTPLQAVPSQHHHNALIVVVLAIVGLILVVAVVVGKGAFKLIHQAVTQVESQELSSSPAMAAMEAASKPVRSNTGGLSPQEALSRERDFRVRQYLEGYKQRGERNPASDALALGFLQNWIASNYGGRVDTNLPPLKELASRLANDTDCTDPIVLTLAGEVDPELHDATRRLDRALTGFQNSRHLAYPKFFATVLLERKLLQEQQSRIPGLDAQALQFLRESFADGSIRPEDQLTLAESLVLGWGDGFLLRNGKAIVQIVRDQGRSYEWLALTLEGENEINEAWKARGDDDADNVTEEGWRGFRDHLALARKALIRAWKLRPDLPLAPSRMMRVCLGEGGIGEMRLWFDRAVEAQIDYADAWDAMRWGLRPRWYGSDESTLAFGVTALKTRRFDTDVPRLYFASVKDVESDMDLQGGQHLYGREDIWPHFQELYEGYIAEPSIDEYDRNGWRNTYAAVAYLAGQYTVAREQLEALHWQVRQWNMSGWGVDLSEMPQEVSARTGSDSNTVNAAESLRQSGDIFGALKAYAALAASTNGDPLTRSFVQDRLATLGLEQRLQGGGWVDFLPTNNSFAGWHVAMGKCEVLPDGALQVSSDEAGHILYSRARIGTNFEVRGQFEVVSSTSTGFQGGLVMGLPQFETYNWYAFRMKRNTDEGDVVTFSEHWSQRQLLVRLPLDSRTNAFTFRFHNGQVSATVNGKEVFQEMDPPAGSSVTMDPCYLGLGAFNDANSTVIRYRNIQVRKLPSK